MIERGGGKICILYSLNKADTKFGVSLKQKIWLIDKEAAVAVVVAVAVEFVY